MSTFGEIVEPGSRTAWEDWDDVIVERSNSDLQWTKDNKIEAKIDTFMLFEGKYLSDCVKAQSKQLELVNTIPEAKLHLFRSMSVNNYVCTVTDYNLILSSEIIELLIPYLNLSNDVIAVQTKALPEFNAAERPTHNCIIRTLTTAKEPRNKLGLSFPKLEQPNMISGVSAGVITLREHQEKSGTAIVCYTEHPEDYQMGEVETILQKLNIGHECKSGSDNVVLASNLYM